METTLYDTNVLIKLVREGVGRVSGFTTTLNLIEFPKAADLKGLRVIVPGTKDYDEAYGISVKLMKAGTPVPATDIVQAAIAINRNLTLRTDDRHFEQVLVVRPKLRLQFAESVPR